MIKGLVANAVCLMVDQHAEIFFFYYGFKKNLFFFG
jgi:hypothetical protein